MADLDEACRAANGGRSVEVPTTVGFCMYIRRAALADVGQFDAETFGRGYGEENDFCVRASARGWHHLLACDTFVFHEGSVSFGAGAKPAERQAIELLSQRYPHYSRLVAKHVRDDPAGPFRFCLTTELFRRSNLPGILMLAHDQGGGVGGTCTIWSSAPQARRIACCCQQPPAAPPCRSRHCLVTRSLSCRPNACRSLCWCCSQHG